MQKSVTGSDENWCSFFVNLYFILRIFLKKFSAKILPKSDCIKNRKLYHAILSGKLCPPPSRPPNISYPLQFRPCKRHPAKGYPPFRNCFWTKMIFYRFIYKLSYWNIFAKNNITLTFQAYIRIEMWVAHFGQLIDSSYFNFIRISH